MRLLRTESVLLSQKAKFSTKVALSLILAYMLPLAFGWSYANVAAITVVFITVTGGAHSSFAMGVVRVVATIFGAIAGIMLLAFFPQERMLYLTVLSLYVTFFAYLYFAYEWDKTVFMLSVVMAMMVFVNGVDNAFMYSVQRTAMTIFGIVVYTLVSLFLWPDKSMFSFDKEKVFSFIWFDPEHLKAALKIFLIYWASVAFWIYMNPAGGFLIVTFAVAVGILVNFMQVKPTVFMILFSFGFVFATLSYVFVLPNLTYGWELALFLFAYTFIGYYLIPAKLSLFFMLGLFMLNIQNTMQYNVAFFMLLLLVFYMVLALVMLFHNFPFSTKPQDLVFLLKERFLKHADLIEKLQDKNGWLHVTLYRYHQKHLHFNLQHLQKTVQKIDFDYFLGVQKEQLEEFVVTCNDYAKGDEALQRCYNAEQKIEWSAFEQSRF